MNRAPTQHRNRYAGLVGPAALVGLCAVWLVYALSLVGVVSGSTRLAAVFVSDDGGNAAGVVHMIAHHTLDYGHAFYPGFYFNVSGLFTLILHLFGVALPHAALLVTRTLSALGGAATLLLTGLLARRLSGSWAAALVAAGILATVPRYLLFSVVAHPDTLQTALMVGSLLVLLTYVSEGSRRYLGWAAALAGLALATKYSGAFLVPVIAGAVVFRARGQKCGWSRDTALTVAREGARSGVIFLGSALLAHPRFLVAGHAYLRAIAVQRSWHAFGHLFRSTGAASTWIVLLGGRTLLGPVVAATFLLAPALGLWMWARRRAVPLTAAQVFAYVATATVAALYLGFLLQGMRDFAPRFLFPAVPFVAAFAAAALFEAVAALPGRVPRGVGFALVAAWAVVAIPLRARAVTALGAARRAVAHNPRLAVGKWLAANVPSDTPMIFDHYTYVSDSLVRSVATWGLRPAEVEKVKPLVVVTNTIIRSRYADLSKAASCRAGSKVFTSIHDEYQALAAGKLDGLRLVARFPVNHTRVYAAGPLADRLAAAVPKGAAP